VKGHPNRREGGPRPGLRRGPRSPKHSPGMDFGLSEEQELLQETVRGFLRGECPESRLREVYDSDPPYDPALWKGLVEIGVAGLTVPESDGGAGLELLDLALLSEVLGAGAAPVPFLGHSLATLALQLGGSDAQRERWLTLLASGEAIGTVALGEGGDVWLPDAWRAVPSGSKLSGTKRSVPHGRFADLVVVGTAGGGLALVETSASGVRLEATDALDRTRPTDTLHLEAAAAEPLPEGSLAAPRVCDAGCVLLAADAFGAAWKLIETTRDYVMTREQFGLPLGQFQAVKHQLANFVAETEPTRGLWWFAAHALDHRPEEAARAAAIAKAHVTDLAMEVARGAFELHGGIGFTWECDVQFWFKRALFDRIFLGTPAIHHDRNAAMAGW
jgi:alkylation response protein AidB-like acyl-CoA dehydrogenase